MKRAAGIVRIVLAAVQVVIANAFRLALHFAGSRRSATVPAGLALESVVAR